MKNIIILFALSLIALSSCSDDKTPTDPGGDNNNAALLPSTVGTYWINSNVSTTPPPNAAPIETSRMSDSSVIVANGMYQGRQASTQITYANGNGFDTTYFNQNSNELYEYSAGIETPFFSIPKGWLKLADYNATTWKPFPDTTLVDNPITFQGIEATVSGTVKANSTKGGTSTVTVDGKTYTATQFTTTIAVDLTGKAFGGVFTSDIKFDLVTRVNHVKGLGVVSSTTDGVVIAVEQPIGNIPQNGSQKTLLRFKINP